MKRGKKVETNPVVEFRTTLRDGRTLNFFVNRDTNLVVLDVIDKDEKGGNEFVRMHVPLPTSGTRG